MNCFLNLKVIDFMPLHKEQIQILKSAIGNYAFPAIYFDFDANCEVNAGDISEVESVISGQLRSERITKVKYGLANVLYWGYANVGFRDIRVNRLLEKVSDHNIQQFQIIVLNNRMPSLIAIKKIGLPEYSGISFVSKILMFLNPESYCVLDKQIAKLRLEGSAKSLNSLKFKTKNTQIGITKHNENIYEEWCKECLNISRTYFDMKYRAVDIERGFFQLIQNGSLDVARRIYDNS